MRRIIRQKTIKNTLSVLPERSLSTWSLATKLGVPCDVLRERLFEMKAAGKIMATAVDLWKLEEGNKTVA